MERHRAALARAPALARVAEFFRTMLPFLLCIAITPTCTTPCAS